MVFCGFKSPDFMIIGSTCTSAVVKDEYQLPQLHLNNGVNKLSLSAINVVAYSNICEKERCEMLLAKSCCGSLAGQQVLLISIVIIVGLQKKMRRTHLAGSGVI